MTWSVTLFWALVIVPLGWAMPASAAPPFREVAPGVGLWDGQRRTAEGPLHVYALKLDPHRVHLEPALAQPGGKIGLAPVSKMANSGGAIAAMNGGFFSWLSGEPQGTLLLHGRLVSRSVRNRPSFWIRTDGRAFIETTEPRPRVRLRSGATIPCMGVNEAAKRHRVVLFTSHFGRTTRTIRDPSRWEVAVDHRGLVVAVGHGNLDIPPEGFVVSAQGRAYHGLRNRLRLHQEVTVDLGLDQRMNHALGGNLVLLRNGTLSEEIGILRTLRRPTREPRTAVGINRDGSYMLVCIDGRRPGHSIGATYVELAEAMRDLGVMDALNLDGGGSTTLWLRGQVINHPSDGWERPVNTALLVVPRRRPIARWGSGMLEPTR